MSGRAQDIAAFLARAGWVGATSRPLVGDASFRRYERLGDGSGRRVVLMDAPPPQENVRPYAAIARHLISLGLSAPRIFAADETAGLLLIEDFGDANMARLVDGGGDKLRLYTLAIDTLIALHRHPEARAAPVPPFDETRLLREVGLVLDWYLPALTGEPAPQGLRVDYLATWRKALPFARGVPDTLVLFDFFPDNLMLLEDARREVPERLREAMLARYLAAFPALDREAFARSFAVMGAQRNLRIVGVFTRLCVRDKKPGYLRHIPWVWRLVERDVAHSALAPLKAWLDRHIPPAMRRIPPCEAAR